MPAITLSTMHDWGCWIILSWDRGKRWALAVVLAYACLEVWSLSWESMNLVLHGPTAFLQPFGPKYAQEWPWVVAHSASACFVLSLGPVLLMRRHFPLPSGWHALLGRAYLLSSLLALGSGLPLGLRAEGGMLATASFFCLSLVWAWASWQAYRSARMRNYAAHQKWIRFHYSLAFSAVLLRIGLNVAIHYDYEVSQVAGLMAWLSWQPALVYGRFLGLSGLGGRKSSSVAPLGGA